MQVRQIRMAVSLPHTTLPETTGTRPKSTAKLVLLALLAIGAVLGSWVLSIHIRYRQQMGAIAAVERLGGSVGYRSDAPEWVQRLQPGTRFGLEPIGPEWLRNLLPAETIVNHLIVVDEVYLDNGPGMHVVSNLSGERQDARSPDPTDADLAQLAVFTQLEKLDLRNTKVGDAGLKHFRNLHGIKALNVGLTQVTDESMPVIAKFEKLQALGLVGTQVTDAGIARLERLKHLEELDVRCTQVTKTGLAPFLARPGLQAQFDDPGRPGLGVLRSY